MTDNQLTLHCVVLSLSEWRSGTLQLFFFFCLSWKHISHTDTQTSATHHSYYGCLISFAQESFVVNVPKQAHGLISCRWSCTIWRTMQNVQHVFNLDQVDCSVSVRVLRCHDVTMFCTVTTAVIHMSCSAVLCWRAVDVHSNDAGLWLPVSARHTHFACHQQGNLDCIRVTTTTPQYCVESLISNVQWSAFCNIWLLSVPRAGPHQTTRLKTWCSWSWATLIPTFSCWWDSWKDSTARWTSTRTHSKYACYCSTELAADRPAVAQLIQYVVCQHVPSVCVTRIY